MTRVRQAALRVGTSRLLRAALLLAVFVCFWSVNRQYSGPAYLSDEIGYLSKAAALAGYRVDMASSWRGGAALFMAPAFLLFSTPAAVWQCVIVLNALMWTASFYLLYLFLKTVFAERSDLAILTAVGASAVYPTWISIGGYAFSTTVFVLVYMLAACAFARGCRSLVLSSLFSLAVGYLYWIHPVGVAVAVASVAATVYCGWKTRDHLFPVRHVIVLLAMMLVYDHAVHPWFDGVMTPVGYVAADHYKGQISTLPARLASVDFWVKLLATLLGHLSYPLIASLGACVFFVAETARRLRRASEAPPDDAAGIRATSALLLLLLSMLGAVALGSILFSISPHSDIDEWFYGRYSDMVFLPALGVCLLSTWRRKYLLVAFSIVWVAVLLGSRVSTTSNTSYAMNLVNVQSFWPATFLAGASLARCLATGSLGIVATFVLGKRYIVLFALPASILAVSAQIRFHDGILASYSKPTSMVQFVRQNFRRGSCVGFDPDHPPKPIMPERRQLYSFYLYDFDVRRMRPEEWLQHCDGPYLSQRGSELVRLEGAAVVARTRQDGVFITVKDAVLPGLRKDALDAGGYDFATADNVRCWSAGCLKVDARQASRLSQVGRLEGSALVTTGRGGFLFFGPYAHLDAGRYLLKLDLEAGDAAGARFEIVSGQGVVKQFEVLLADHVESGRRTVSVPFRLAQGIDDMEARLYVGDKSSISFHSYEITRIGE